MSHDSFSAVEVILRQYVSEQINYLLPFVDPEDEKTEIALRKELDEYAKTLATNIKEEIDEHISMIKGAL